jgi:hypothetical protein
MSDYCAIYQILSGDFESNLARPYSKNNNGNILIMMPCLKWRAIKPLLRGEGKGEKGKYNPSFNLA